MNPVWIVILAVVGLAAAGALIYAFQKKKKAHGVSPRPYKPVSQPMIPQPVTPPEDPAIRNDYIQKILAYEAHILQRKYELTAQKPFEAVADMLCFAAVYAQKQDDQIRKRLLDSTANEGQRLMAWYEATKPDIEQVRNSLTCKSREELESMTQADLESMAQAEPYPFVRYRTTLEDDAFRQNALALCSGDLSVCDSLRKRMEALHYQFVMYHDASKPSGTGTPVDYAESNCGFSYPALYYRDPSSAENALRVNIGGVYDNE